MVLLCCPDWCLRPALWSLEALGPEYRSTNLELPLLQGLKGGSLGRAVAWDVMSHLPVKILGPSLGLGGELGLDQFASK
jgi:hypothetical protein